MSPSRSGRWVPGSGSPTVRGSEPWQGERGALPTPPDSAHRQRGAVPGLTREAWAPPAPPLPPSVQCGGRRRTQLRRKPLCASDPPGPRPRPCSAFGVGDHRRTPAPATPPPARAILPSALDHPDPAPRSQLCLRRYRQDSPSHSPLTDLSTRSAPRSPPDGCWASVLKVATRTFLSASRPPLPSSPLPSPFSTQARKPMGNPEVYFSFDCIV